MKKLSNQAKSNIFLLASLVAALSGFWWDSSWVDVAWGILLSVGYYYHGKHIATIEAERKQRSLEYQRTLRHVW